MSARPGIVGAFILGAMGLAVAGILFFGGTRMFTRTLHAVAFFGESVAGLEVGSGSVDDRVRWPLGAPARDDERRRDDRRQGARGC